MTVMFLTLFVVFLFQGCLFYNSDASGNECYRSFQESAWSKTGDKTKLLAVPEKLQVFSVIPDCSFKQNSIRYSGELYFIQVRAILR